LVYIFLPKVYIFY